MSEIDFYICVCVYYDATQTFTCTHTHMHTHTHTHYLYLIGTFDVLQKGKLFLDISLHLYTAIMLVEIYNQHLTGKSVGNLLTDGMKQVNWFYNLFYL